MTYTELSTAIQAYLQNYETDFVDNIPTFVKQAETRIAQAINLPVSRLVTTESLVAGGADIELPSGVVSIDAVAIVAGTGAYTYLIGKDDTFMREAYPNPATEGVPRYYAIRGPATASAAQIALVVGPTADADYDVEVQYMGYPESIVTAENTWLGDNFDSVLLYGALVEGNTFMKGEEDMTKQYELKYQEALMLAKQLTDGKLMRDMYRAR